MSISKSFWEKFGNEANAKQKFSIRMWLQIKSIFSPCCGLGRKVVFFSGANGGRIAISFPLVFDGTTYTDKQSFELAVATKYGYGVTTIVLNPATMLVLTNRSLKDPALNNLPNIPDSVTIG